VNDRGPFHADRVIDLSWTAAAKLGYVGSGSTLVEVELIQPDDFPLYARRSDPATVATANKAPPPTGFALISSAQAAESPGGAPVYLQLGAFAARENADSLRERVMNEVAWLKDFVEVLQRDGSFRVQVGPYKNRADASAAAQQVREALQVNPVVVTK
jgi:rare lipoprotein A